MAPQLERLPSVIFAFAVFGTSTRAQALTLASRSSTSFDMHEAETRTIMAVEMDGLALILDSPLNYSHIGSANQVYGSRSMSMQVRILYAPRVLVHAQ
jgi:hypothetical protein